MTDQGAAADIVQSKRTLRSRIKALRTALSAEDRRLWSTQAAAHLMSSPLWGNARSVALFRSMGDEIETETLLRSIWDSGRAAALPVAPPLGSALEFRWVSENTPMVRSRYGALEPSEGAARVEASELDLLVVPGLAFDEHGARLGYGGGYYDRTLANAGPAVMFCFGCQQVERVPEGEHDRRVAAVITENGYALAPINPIAGSRVR